MAFIDELLSGNNSPQTGFVDFISSDHIRYQNGINVSGHNPNCHRKIRIENNISHQVGYTVSIYNMDCIHPIWGDYVQMAPKQMMIISYNQNKIVLRGYGCDQMGNPFSDYGLEIFVENMDILKCVLYMYDRDCCIKYYK